ncbi:hypothetical protein GQ457_12G011830 [Hibiscus cannabinus]
MLFVDSDIAADDTNFSIVGRVFTTAEVDGATLIPVRADIFKRGPWVFNNDWFALIPLNPMLSIDEYHFNRMVIWVRILLVPIGLMNEVLGRSLGACIGIVVGTDTRVIDGNMGEFLRVHISIDVKTIETVCSFVAAVDLVSGDVLAVDPMGTVHVSEPSFLGDERDVLVTHSSHLEIASITDASNFETIDEWFAEDAETNIMVVVAPPLQVPAKPLLNIKLGSLLIF